MTPYEQYAATFGEKAAKRNAGRIARLADVIQRLGAVTLRSEIVYFRDPRWREINDTCAVLGATTLNSSGKQEIVYAIPDSAIDAQADTPTASHMA